MNTNTLRVIAGDIVTQSKLTKPAKLQLLNWLQNEATEVQIKAMLLDGEPFAELDESAEEIVNKRFEQHELSEGWGTTILGMFLLSPLGWAAYRAIRGMFSKASRKCGTFSIGKQRDLCLLRVKFTRAQKMLNLFKKEMKNCSKAKKPDKCKQKGMKQIEKWQGEVNEFQERIKDMKGSGGFSIQAGGTASAGKD